MRQNQHREDDTPADGYDTGYLVYQIRTDFHDLCRRMGFENARQEVAEIILSEMSRDRK